MFEVFLPQLLLYPNPSDPLNGEAAALLMRDRPAYEQKVKGNHHIYLTCITVTSVVMMLYIDSLYSLHFFANSRKSEFISFAIHGSLTP